MQEILGFGPLVGGAEIAPACLSGAFEQMPDGQPLREPVPVVPAPVELVHDRAERERGIGDTAGDYDIGAAPERLRDRLRAQIGAGKQQALAHRRDVGAGVHMRQRLAARLQLVESIRDRVARHRGNLRFPPIFAERAGDRFARALRIEAAGIHHEFHAVLGGERPQLGQHRHGIARVAGGRVLLPILLQDREGELGEVVGRDVVDAAALDRGANRAPGIAVEAQPGADTDRFHAPKS